LPPWPTFQVGAQPVPAQVCIVPGHLAEDLALRDNTYYCGVSDERLAVTPDLATLFVLSFSDPNPTPLSPRVISLGARGIRLQACKRLLGDATVLISHLKYAVDTLESGGWGEFSTAAALIDGRLQGMAKRGSWLVGVMAIEGGPEDPYLAYLRQRMTDPNAQR
jgi:hypothetical protein